MKQRYHHVLKYLTVLCLAAAVLQFAVGMPGARGENAKTPVNVALNQAVSAEHSYDTGGDYYSPAYLTDGRILDVGTDGPSGLGHIGWSSDPTDTSIGDTTPINLVITLQKPCDISRIQVYPMEDSKHFPKKYELYYSADGTAYHKLTDSIPYDGTTNPQVYSFDAVRAQSVKLRITQSSGLATYGGYLSQIAEVEIYGMEITEDDLQNVALGKEVNAEKSYYPPEECYHPSFITDGRILDVGTDGAGGLGHIGWSSDPVDASIEDTTPIELIIDLGKPHDISRIYVYPMQDTKYFPKKYELYLSADGESWTKTADSSPYDGSVSPQTYSFETIRGQYVKLRITQSSGLATYGGYLSQIAEVEVYGKPVHASELEWELNKSALRMRPGETDRIIVYAGDEAQDAEYATSDAAVVSVGPDGTVEAAGEGSAVISVRSAKGDFEVPVIVDHFSATEQFMITTFRSPSKPYLTPETYDLLAAAGFNNIQNEYNTTVNTLSDNLLMAKYCYERGMVTTVSLGAWSDGFRGLSEAEIAKRLEKFSHVPGVGGVYIIDEPYNANSFAASFPAIRSIMPGCDIHLNFLPLLAYPNATLYRAQMYDFAQLTNGCLDYLMYDMYPFGLAADSFNEAGWYQNLDVVRKLGLELNIKTGTFMQSISMRNGYRRPNGDELRFTAYSAAAYGYKQIAYFCWETPNEKDYGFGPAIVDIYNQPTEIYEPIKKTNNELLQLGPTLMRLDAVYVYTIGKSCSYGIALPADYFLQFNEGANLVVSYMRDKTNGRNYSMLVNRDLKKAQTITVTPAQHIDGIEEIRKTDGTAAALAKNSDGTYTITLQAGDGILLRMPEQADYTPDYKVFQELPAGSNLANRAIVNASYSDGENGCYMAFVNDGVKTASADNRGFGVTAEDGKAWLSLDLGTLSKFTRIDLYDGQDGTALSSTFPAELSIEISADGTQFTTLVPSGAPKKADGKISYTFDEVSARYVRIHIEKMNRSGAAYHAEIAEVEVYRDTQDNPGTTPDKGNETNPSTQDHLILKLCVLAVLLAAAACCLVIRRQNKKRRTF